MLTCDRAGASNSEMSTIVKRFYERLLAGVAKQSNTRVGDYASSVFRVFLRI